VPVGHFLSPLIIALATQNNMIPQGTTKMGMPGPAITMDIPEQNSIPMINTAAPSSTREPESVPLLFIFFFVEFTV
jgi:hypothetical protein